MAEKRKIMPEGRCPSCKQEMVLVYSRRSAFLRRVGRIFDGASAGLDEVRRMSRWPSRPGEPQYAWEAPRTAIGVKDRTNRLKALGNAVVWPCFYPFAVEIYEYVTSNQE